MNRRKKGSKYRGSKTHGGGSKKKRRGAGNRGGRGMAGSGKRADQKKMSIFKEFGNTYFGKHGFNRPPKVVKEVKTINLGELNKFKDSNIDLKKLGFDKLLGKGNIKKKITVEVKMASKKAIERIESAGGKITLENGNDK